MTEQKQPHTGEGCGAKATCSSSSNCEATATGSRQQGALAHPLVGAGVHFKDDKGEIVNQAMIVAVVPSNAAAVGDLVLLQYFSWIAGDPTNRRLIPLATLASSKAWALYKSVDEMNSEYEYVSGGQL